MPLNTLVSWGEDINLGLVQDSEWICPRATSLVALGEWENRHGPPGPDEIRRLADGRQHAIELHEFPEGLQFATIVDMRAGTHEPLTAVIDAQRYGGLKKSLAEGTHPYRVPLLEGQALALGSKRDLLSIANYKQITAGQLATSCVIKPTQVAADDLDYVQRSKSALRITPGMREISLTTTGKRDDAVEFEMEVNEKESQLNAALTIQATSWMKRNAQAEGLVRVEFDGEGQVKKVTAGGPGLLSILGVKLVTPVGAVVREIVDAPGKDRERGRLLYELGDKEIIDLGSKTLDLSRTAAMLYAGFSEVPFDPTRALSFR